MWTWLSMFPSNIWWESIYYIYRGVKVATARKELPCSMSKFRFLCFNFTGTSFCGLISQVPNWTQLNPIESSCCPNLVIKTYILSQFTSARYAQKCFRSKVDLWSRTDQLWSKGLKLMQEVMTCKHVFSQNSGHKNNDLNLPLLHLFTV